MVIYDISKELFSTTVYPGDPVPTSKSWFALERGDVCNLTSICLGSHSGTHIDAPKHFMAHGKDVAEVSLQKCVGDCQVVYCNGEITEEFIKNTLEDGIDKILFRGDVVLGIKAADSIVKRGINLVGVEASTVGDKQSQVLVHQKLLNNEIVILENLQLDHVPEGKYFLAAQPLKMQGVDGSPVRAILIADD